MPSTMTHNPTVNTTYGIQCTGSGPSGSTAFTATTYVTVTPVGGGTSGISVSPSIVNSGQSVTASWNVASWNAVGLACRLRYTMGTATGAYTPDNIPATGNWTITATNHVQFAITCGHAQALPTIFGYVAVRGANVSLFPEGPINGDNASLWYKVVDADGDAYQHAVRIDGLERQTLAAGVSRFDATMADVSTQDGQNHTVSVCRKSGTQLSLCSGEVTFKQRCDSTPGGACNQITGMAPSDPQLASVVLAYESILKQLKAYLSQISH